MLQSESKTKASKSTAPLGRVPSRSAPRRITPTTSSITAVDKELPNGDLYIGGLSTSLAPHGEGKYLWSDGCVYEGEWRRGRAWGKGKLTWPSGATFEGEFKEGKMDGFGSYIGSDGGSYRGSWAADMKHGYGEKRYCNGDWYEGSWRRNLQDGHGRYVWRNGNEYVGDWSNCVINGRGVLIWANGNRYDGNWENGVPKGHGVFTWAEGSCYVGNWSKDLKNETQNTNQNYPHPILSGTFYPGLNKNTTTSMKHYKSQSLILSHKDNIPLVMDDNLLVATTQKRSSVDEARKSWAEKNFPRICIWESDGEAGDITCDIVDNVEASKFYRDGTGSDSDDVRDLKKGLVCFNGELRKPGQTISKGHKNYDLMLNLQLGIRYSVGKHGAIQRELKPRDFDPMEKFWTRFPPVGSKITPPHQSDDFWWKDYCPMVFRHLRDHFQVDPADYMLAICGNEALREFSSPGKSRSVFYLTQDDRFMIKTVKKSECKVLIKMLPSYYQHVYRYKNTLVTKFFGVHCVKPVGGVKTRFIVMGNLFCSEDRIHRRFDLKGSSHGRTTDKRDGEIDETTTLKDLDLNFVFRLKSNWFQEFIKQINKDCEFLEAERIMDYSLLVGVHFHDNTRDGIILEPILFQTGRDSLEKDKFICGCCFFKSQLQDMDRVLAGRKTSVGLGANMPARAEKILCRNEMDQCTSDGSYKPVSSQGSEIYEVVLYFGIIDILQDYDITKKLERAYKSLQADPASISAVDPKLYSKRFCDFIGKVFIEDRL